MQQSQRKRLQLEFESLNISWSLIHPTFQSFDGCRLDDSRIGLLGEEASSNADRVFDGPFFVAVVWLTEIGLSSQDAVGRLGVLRAFCRERRDPGPSRKR